MRQRLEEEFVIKENRVLRFGYTTGTCAAAAAKAAVTMLFSQSEAAEVTLTVPKGYTLTLKTLEVSMDETSASCAIQKDGGDDPDVTHGLLVYARAEHCSRDQALELCRTFGPQAEPVLTDDQAVVGITGGVGVGTITLPGLEQAIGAPAINVTPRAMITREVQEVCQSFGYTGGICITVSAPDAVELADKTFNPRLGIQGGISILGTSGIVEPMSEQALIRTIEVEMKHKFANMGDYLLVTPGNYGTHYLKDHFPFGPEDAVKCSNFVGQTIDLAVNLGVKGILFVAHIGKFIKVAGGIMNTHSRDADSRMELLAVCALRAGADREIVLQILDAVTTDEGLKVLQEAGFLEAAMELMMEKIHFYLNHRGQQRIRIGAIVFSNVYGELGRTSEADALMEALLNQTKGV